MLSSSCTRPSSCSPSLIRWPEEAAGRVWISCSPCRCWRSSRFSPPPRRGAESFESGSLRQISPRLVIRRLIVHAPPKISKPVTRIPPVSTAWPQGLKRRLGLFPSADEGSSGSVGSSSVRDGNQWRRAPPFTASAGGTRPRSWCVRWPVVCSARSSGASDCLALCLSLSLSCALQTLTTPVFGSKFSCMAGWRGSIRAGS